MDDVKQLSKHSSRIPRIVTLSANIRRGQDVPPPKSMYKIVESGSKGRKQKSKKNRNEKLAKHMDSWDKDFKNEWLYTCKLEKKLCEVKDKVEKKEEEKVRNRVGKNERVLVGWYDMMSRSYDAIDV
ncbi:hypothetical protein Tco_0378669 [Tanacetum coccineum]